MNTLTICLLMLGLSLAINASPASAIGPLWQLPAGSVETIGADSIWWFGRVASLRSFDAPGHIAEVAAALIAQVSPPPRLQPMPDGLLIVGMAGRVHWLVRLVASSATRTQGSASAVDLSDAPTLAALPWQPAGMVMRLDLAARDDAAMVRQQILSDGGSPESLRKRLCGALRVHGWRPDTTTASDPCAASPLAWPVTGFWQRRDATLALVIDQLAIDQQPTGSSLFVMQTDPLPSTFADLWRKPRISHDRSGSPR
jgi:hypothetical protein